MQGAATAVTDFASARNLIQGYFESWSGTDEDEILAWYSDDVNLWLPTGMLEGKMAVRDQFVRPFVAAFPGNVHEIQRLIYQDGVVVVEWRFKAEHCGEFLGVPPSGRRTDVPGCSVYFLGEGTTTGGSVYFNVPTLLEQISAAA